MSGQQVTVVLFAYNQERFVEAALDGVYAQTHRPFRLVVCDDASTDATRARIEEKLRSCPADIEVVRAYSDTNFGIGGIINHASAHFDGQTVVFMAGDDVSEPDRVAVAHQAISAGAGFHYTAVRKMDAAGAFIEEAGIRQDMECAVSDFVSGKIPPVVGASCSYTRDVFTFFGPIDVSLMQEDVILPLRGLLLGGGKFDGRPLVRYRTHGANLFSPSHRQSSTEMARRHLRFAPSRAAFCRQLGQDLLAASSLKNSTISSLANWLAIQTAYSNLESACLLRASSLRKSSFLFKSVFFYGARLSDAAKVFLFQVSPGLLGLARNVRKCFVNK